MLKKMRWRFISTAMLAFFVVIFSLSCFVNVWNYISVSKGQDNILLELYNVEEKETPSSAPPIEHLDKYSKEVPYMIRFFSIEYVDDDINVYQEYIASLSNDQAIEYGNAIKANKETSGYYRSYRYLKVIDEDKTTILFLNSEREMQMMKTLLLITLIISLLSLIVVFLLVTIFSKYAIAPYLKNMEAQKQFITNASHELKTPLTSISTSADVLSMEYENNEWVENIRKQSNKLSKLISNLILLSRLNEENPFANKCSFSISDALWEISESFISLAQGKNKKMSLKIEDGLAFEGDKTSFGQCISILLDNAIKYSSNQGDILLDAHKKGKRIEIIVENNYDEKIVDLDRLFERFYRNDLSHSNKISGSGIGLSIAKETIEKQGGTISACQCENKLKFIIVL